MEEINEKEREIERLDILLDDISGLNQEIEQQEEILEDEELIKKALKLTEEIQTKQEKWNRLNQLMAKIGSRQIAIVAHDVQAKRLQKKFDEEFPDVCPLCNRNMITQ